MGTFINKYKIILGLVYILLVLYIRLPVAFIGSSLHLYNKVKINVKKLSAYR